MEYFASFNSITTLLALLLLFVITLFYLNKPHNKKKVKQCPLPPGPKPWPIVGCLPTMLRNKPVSRWIHNLMNEMNTKIACIRLGKVHVIPVTCPDIACEFLKAQDNVFISRPNIMSANVLSRGYLTTALTPFGDQWEKMKKVLMTQVLSPVRHQWLYNKRVEEGDHLVHYVSNLCKKSDQGGIVNLRTTTQHYCANLIRKLIFNRRFFGEGMRDGGPGLEEEQHVDAIFTGLKYIYSFCVSDFMPSLLGLDLDGHEKVMKESTEIINKYHDPIIDERIRQWQDGTEMDNIEDLLDVLITLKDANGNSLLSKDEIKAQIIEMMIATVDNPSNACEWAFAEMLNQPEIMEKAVEELDRVVGKERLVQESDFAQLNYLKACAREAFRLHPVVPFNVPHVSIADTTAAGYFIPKGSYVVLSRVGLGRNSKVWEDPLKFKPERHLDLNRTQNVVLTENNLRFISFSTGKRGCKGVTLGTSMTIMLFARLLQGFTWSLPSGQSGIDLTMEEDSMALVKPLIAVAKPRLSTHLYPS